MLFALFVAVLLCSPAHAEDDLDALLDAALVPSSSPTSSPTLPKDAQAEVIDEVKKLLAQRKELADEISFRTKESTRIRTERNAVRRSKRRFEVFAREPLTQKLKEVWDKRAALRRDYADLLKTIAEYYRKYQRRYGKAWPKCPSGSKTMDCVSVLVRSEKQQRDLANKPFSTSANQGALLPSFLRATLSALVLGSLMGLFVLVFFWQLGKKSTVTMLMVLGLFFLSNSLRLVFNGIWIMNKSISHTSFLALLLVERVSYALDLGVVFLFFNLWMEAAKEMSRTEHSLVWKALRIISVIALLTGLVMDVAGSVIFVVAFDNPNVNGYLAFDFWIVSPVVRLVLSLGLLALSAVTYRLTTKTAMAEKVLPAFRRMLVAQTFVGVSSILFCARELYRVQFTYDGLRLWQVLFVADVLLFIGLVVAFISYFTQWRMRIQAEQSEQKQARLEPNTDGPVGLDMENYNY